MIALLLSCAMCVPPTTNVDSILDAIQKVETGGVRDPSNAVGDNGKAIGPYQIHLVYWKDAVQYDPSIGGTYTDCKDPEYARQIVIAYLSRYAPNWECETVARIHNGGPKGYLRRSTLAYWKKVKKVYND